MECERGWSKGRVVWSVSVGGVREECVECECGWSKGRVVWSVSVGGVGDE